MEEALALGAAAKTSLPSKVPPVNYICISYQKMAGKFPAILQSILQSVTLYTTDSPALTDTVASQGNQPSPIPDGQYSAAGVEYGNFPCPNCLRNYPIGRR